MDWANPTDSGVARAVAHTVLAPWAVRFGGYIDDSSLLAPSTAGPLQAVLVVDDAVVVAVWLEHDGEAWVTSHVAVCPEVRLDDYGWSSPVCAVAGPSLDYEGSPEAPTGSDGWSVVATTFHLDEGQLLVEVALGRYIMVDDGHLAVDVVGGWDDGHWTASGAFVCEEPS